MFLLVYVDDIILIGNDSSLIQDSLAKLSYVFKIRDLGSSWFFLGIETVPVDGAFVLSQRRYMDGILKRVAVTVCKLLATLTSITRLVSSLELFDDPTKYRSLAGTLQYLTRPDMSFAVNHLCQFMHSPTVEHSGLLKRVLRY